MKESLSVKEKADKDFSDALAAEDIERIKATMNLCDLADKKLLQCEHQERIKQINKIHVNNKCPYNISMNRDRECILKALKEIINENTKLS